MSCIVGYIDKLNKKTYIGADSCASTDMDKKTLGKSFKIFKPDNNPNFLIGTTGSIRALQIVKNFLPFPTENLLLSTEREVNEDYIVSSIVPKIQEAFVNNKCGDKGKDLGWSTIMIAYKDRLFIVEDDYGVIEYPTFKAIGSGVYHADGALFALNENDSSEDEVDKILIALKASSSLSRGVAGPFYVMNTQNKDCLKFDY